MPNPSLAGPSRPPKSGKAGQLIVLLHGWGADGANLIDIGDALSPLFPHAHFVAPNAPQICEVNPYGYQWFSLMDRQPQHMLEGARAAADSINHFLDEQLAALKLDNSQLALIGFSQGTMVGLHVALRRSPAIAGLVGFSGSLIGPDMLSREIAARPPICLIHGEMDDVVPYKSLAAAVESLKSHGVPTEDHTRPRLGHSIDMDGLKIAAEFLKKNLG